MVSMPHSREGFYIPTYNPLHPVDTRQDENGLYYRVGTHNDHLADEVSRFEKGDTEIGALSFDAYQYFVDQAWKTPHDSSESTERWRDKILEERNEWVDALSSGNPEKVIDELGDLLFTMTAIGNNDGGTIGPELRKVLFEYIIHSRVLDSHDGLPVWRPFAIQLATGTESLKVKDVDALATAGFEPIVEYKLPYYENEVNVDIDESVWQLSMLSALVQSQASVFREGRTRFNPEQADYTDTFASDPRLRQMLAQTILIATHIAHMMDSSLEAVIERNMQKVGMRIAHNRIDKQDGVRDSSLL